ncbi:hypothetical protein SUDANB43_05092 [Streptomyces sp. enrichment culture]
MCLRGLTEQVPVWLVPSEDVQRGMWLRLGMFPEGRQRRIRGELDAATQSGKAAEVSEPGDR